MLIVMTGKERDGMLSLKGIMFFRRAMLFQLIVVCELFLQTAAAADSNAIYQQSTDALYNLDFSTAQSGYEGLTREFPDNPDYWNGLASSIWLKVMFDQQKLNIESFSSRSSFGTRESGDTVSAPDEKRF